MVYAGDLKSPEGNLVRVRLPPGPPKTPFFAGVFLFADLLVHGHNVTNTGVSNVEL